MKTRLPLQEFGVQLAAIGFRREQVSRKGGPGHAIALKSFAGWGTGHGHLAGEVMHVPRLNTFSASYTLSFFFFFDTLIVVQNGIWSIPPRVELL